jgi:hypothetical protein
MSENNFQNDLLHKSHNNDFNDRIIDYIIDLKFCLNIINKNKTKTNINQNELNEIITNILDLFYNFKENYKNYSTRNGVNEIKRYNAFESYNNIYKEECKESYKKHINNLTKDKIKYVILKEKINIYYIGSSLNNNINNKIINKSLSLNNNNNNNI